MKTNQVLIIENFIQNKKVLHVKNAINPCPDWSDFIEVLNKKFNNPSGSSPDPRLVFKVGENGKSEQTDILVYNKFDPVIFNVVDYAHGQFASNDMPAAHNFSNIFKNIFPHHAIKAIINFVGNEYKYWVHKDDHEVISWHCIGQMEWRIYEDIDDSRLNSQNFEGLNYNSYIVNPGDILYVPAGVAHSVLTEGPRASLILDGA